ncbi:MAG: hypothetical protein C4B59_07985 [Candidatus Methanogaster sp.]|uniref:Uncharacterized protein n=1 Tax=Candidatus Methanogaster sp. TaxID=3386292 RepID=A0AC61L361_9EURY|nr:MAG: hypothetical protein C4B59_07985 [ANME-2 cluster archaeon]
MNIKKLIGASMITLLVVAISVGMAAAYTIDGDLSDWGVDVDDGADWSLDATWLPNDGVRFQVEDNVDPKRDAEPLRWKNGIAAYATGVHITGVGSNYLDYDEARVTGPVHTGWAFPTGGTGESAEAYDQEAIYIDEDADNLYFAIVLSCDANSYSGDLGLDITSASGGRYIYEYGVVLHDNADTYTASDRDIMNVSEWSECTTIVESSPARIVSGDTVGTATVAYVKNGPDPEPFAGYPATYIIEGKIPKSAIGAPASVSLGQYHYTVLCGNDEIPIPEFGLLAIPVLALIGLVFIMRRRKE